MRTLVGMGMLLVSLAVAVAQEPPAVSSPPVGPPMRIAPAVVGQPLNPKSPAEPAIAPRIADTINPPQLLIAAPPPPVVMPEPPRVHTVETNP
jgi:hypothetical protein